MVVLMDQLSWW